MENWREYSHQKQKQVASSILFNNKNLLLIIRRSNTDPWRPGWWDLPGGNIDKGETPIEAAVREAKEEANLTVNNLVKVKTVMGKNILKHYFTTKDWSGEISFNANPSSGYIEHDSYRWVSIQELTKIQNSIVPVYIARAALNKITI